MKYDGTMVKKEKKKEKTKSKKVVQGEAHHSDTPDRNERTGLTDKISRLFFIMVKRRTPTQTISLKAAQYYIKGLISEGTFGQVMLATNVNTNVTVAAKLELLDAPSPQLKSEYKMYEILGSETPGFIKIFHFGPCNKLYNCLIMELLGPDLDDLFVGCKQRFSHKTVLMIAMQTLRIIKHVHSRRIVYRDIKPENFCIGHRFQNKEKVIHIVDFGLSTMVDDSDSKQSHYSMHKHYLIGTARYMSINAHNGLDQSRRDDLESLGYMYIYFLKGRLPWMGLSKTSHPEGFANIGEMKSNITAEELVPKQYPELIEYLNYVRKLQHREMPNYEYLLSLMEDSFQEHGYIYDCEFDWTATMNKRFLKQAIEIDPDD